MYFPYLRGRQNELLCLRELLDRNKLSDTIVPVIGKRSIVGTPT